MSIQGATPLSGLMYKMKSEEMITLIGTNEELQAAREYMEGNGYEFRSNSEESPNIYATLTMARTVCKEGTLEA